MPLAEDVAEKRQVEQYLLMINGNMDKLKSATKRDAMNGIKPSGSRCLPGAIKGGNQVLYDIIQLTRDIGKAMASPNFAAMHAAVKAITFDHNKPKTFKARLLAVMAISADAPTGLVLLHEAYKDRYENEADFDAEVLKLSANVLTRTATSRKRKDVIDEDDDDDEDVKLEPVSHKPIARVIKASPKRNRLSKRKVQLKRHSITTSQWFWMRRVGRLLPELL